MIIRQCVELKKALPSLLFGLAVGMIQGCGDGGISGSDPATSIPVGVNSATLSWEKPTTNQDGSPLTDLAGYQIYYGQTTPVARDNSQSTSIGDPDQMTYVVSGLDRGTYYFSVTAFDLNGNESPMSEEVSKVF